MISIANLELFSFFSFFIFHRHLNIWGIAIIHEEGQARQEKTPIRGTLEYVLEHFKWLS